MHNNDPILLVNDMVGYGKVSAAAMLPILSYLGHPVSTLPTALVSNTFNYGQYAMVETTDYIRQVLPAWQSLGFSFSAVCTGFLCSDAQASLVAQLCSSQAQRGARIFVDPVMGDDGDFYVGISPDRAVWMRQIISVAHLSFPNYTEACLLTGTPWNPNGMSSQQAIDLAAEVVKLGSRSVLITSARVDGHSAVVGYNADEADYFVLPYDEVPAFFHGTGDVFSAIVVGRIMSGSPLRDAAQHAIDALFRLIQSNKDLPDKLLGLPIENCLHLI